MCVHWSYIHYIYSLELYILHVDPEYPLFSVNILTIAYLVHIFSHCDLVSVRNRTLHVVTISSCWILTPNSTAEVYCI